jgi:glycosyltransferase involved in cell wall biosynthesis
MTALGDVAQTLARAPALLHRVDADLDRLEAAISRPRNRRADLRQRPIYLRTDLCLGLRAGGSVAHTAGVLNELDAFAGRPIFICPDPLPLVRPDIETIVIRPDRRRWLRSEWALLDFNRRVLSEIGKLLPPGPVGFLYHRYSLDSFAAVALSIELGAPLVLEYNGSELWVAQHWGKGLVEARRAERIEMLNLRAADLITVVSAPLREQLIHRGIDPEKILVNPNGVDPGTFSPEIDGTAIRRRLGLGDGLVIGFIGTFGPWHGAEVLADAFARMLASEDVRRLNPRLLLVGDGVRRANALEILRQTSADRYAVTTGLVPQEEAPQYLAACDILVAPHVPNPDGSVFFGSPTKLFEYMAMGKAVVASKLGQIGDVLAPGTTALLVPPGEPAPLAEALGRLAGDPELRRRLGAAARAAVLRGFTWKSHVARIIERLAERAGRGTA